MSPIKEPLPSLLDPSPPTEPPHRPEPPSAPNVVVHTEARPPSLVWAAFTAPFRILLVILRLPFEVLRAFSFVPLAIGLYALWVYGFEPIERFLRLHVGFEPSLLAVLVCVAITVAGVKITKAFRSILDILTGRDLRRVRKGRKVEVHVERREQREARRSQKTEPVAQKAPVSATPATPAEVFSRLREAGLSPLADNAEAIVRLVHGFSDPKHPLRTAIDDGLRTILGRALAIVHVEPRSEKRSIHMRNALEECNKELQSLRDACEQVFLKALPSATQSSLEDVLRRIQAEQRVLDEVGTRL